MAKDFKQFLYPLPRLFLDELGFDYNTSASSEWITDGHSIMKVADVRDANRLALIKSNHEHPKVSLIAMQKLWNKHAAENLRRAFALGCVPVGLPLAYAAIRRRDQVDMWVNAYKLAYMAEMTQCDYLAVTDSDKWAHSALRFRKDNRTVGLLMPIRPESMMLLGPKYDLSAKPVVLFANKAEAIK